MSSSTRINFISGVADILHRRAGGKCSVPRCKNPTMGPFIEFEGAVNMGVACHIYSASKNGPRGWGGKPPEFISSAENGIWCCQYHANLIDKIKGNDYPTSVLFLWKKLTETRVLKHMNDFPSPLGWVDSIKFTTFLNNTNPPKLKLSRYTLIWGENGVGKTVLLEIAAAISNSKYANRFNGTKIKNEVGHYIQAKFKAEVIYTTVDYPNKEINLEVKDRKLFRIENKITCLLPPGDLEVIYCSNKDRTRLDDIDDIDFMMEILHVDKSALFALADIGTKVLFSGEITFEQAKEDEDDWEKTYPKNKNDGEPYYELMFKHKDSNNFICFNALSSSEQGMLILDLQITKAREIAKQRLTLLLIEDLAISLDSSNFEKLLNILEKEDFQVIVSIPPYRVDSIIDNNILKDLDYLKQWKLELIGIQES